MVAWNRFASKVVALSLVVVIAGCGEGTGALPANTPSPSRVRPTVVEVRCDSSRTHVSTSTAVVDRDGLHLQVTDYPGHNGTYLNYSHGAANGTGPGGGDPVPAGTTDRVLQVPPGDVYLECSYRLGATTTAWVKVRASDPHGYYRPVTLAALGCNSGATLDWAVGPARGKTAKAALDSLLLLLASEQGAGASLHSRLAPIGYVGSGVRTYILERGSRPWATAVVSSEGGQYVAMLDALC